ncbi:14312_t:CDS:10 [Ambispora leptoticha]|uniref:14312_t:CDS:1 n=1 Tax=Ambispora leptoticha TaxID=144679 RepID=A0A9N8VUM0_9GLOM|nr:14312_t:CDS:10 [Ambispora leptoticha]
MSMAQEEELTAFIDWANALDNISRPVNNYTDLADGGVLIEIACDVDSRWFKSLRGDTREDTENWVIRSTKLKRLYTLIQRYYKEEIGHDTKNFDDIDLNAIAKESDTKELIKLCSLILTMAVQSSRNAYYIERIQSLSDNSQKGLMVAIERVMKKLENGIQESTAKQPFNFEEELRQITAELNRAISDKETLEKAHQALMEEHKQLRYRYDDLQTEIQTDKDELNQKIKDLEASLQHTTQSGRADFLLKTQIDDFRQQMQRSELEKTIEEQTKLLSELRNQVKEYSAKADETARLKDQLDEYRHAAEKLKKTENVIEKYKKKLEDGADLRRKLKNLEEDNHDLIERNRQIEDEYRKVANFKPTLDQYKRTIEALEKEKRELIDVRNKYEYEYKHMRAKIEAYEMEKARDMEKIELMEERLRELELVDGERLDRIPNENGEKDDDFVQPNYPNYGETQLKLRINELQRELDGWREGKQPVDESEIIMLNQMLDDAKKSKEKLEKDLSRTTREKIEIESKLARYESSFNNSGLDINKNSGARDRELFDTKKKLIEAQSKLKELEAEREQLQAKNNELTALIDNLENRSEDDFKAENIKLHRQNADRAKKIDQLKELVKAQHEVIETSKIAESSLKVEREAHAEEVKRYQSMIEELKKQAAFEQNLITAAWYDMGRRIQRDNVSFQRIQPTSWLGQQRRDSRGSIDGSSSVKYIRKMNEVEKELFNSIETLNTAVSSLKIEREAHAEEAKRYQSMIEELKKQAAFEQNLITAAWYDMGRRIQRDNVSFQRIQPTSWLGQQRRDSRGSISSLKGERKAHAEEVKRYQSMIEELKKKAAIEREDHAEESRIEGLEKQAAFEQEDRVEEVKRYQEFKEQAAFEQKQIDSLENLKTENAKLHRQNADHVKKI